MSREFKEKSLYKEIVVKNNNKKREFVPGTKIYKGISTVHPDNTSPSLYDLGIIKQDLLNHFHIRQGEKLSDPTFGCILWDLLFEPLTEQTRNLIVKNVNEIIDHEKRVSATGVRVEQYEHGLAVYCELTYLPYNISETLRFNFDKNAGYAYA